MEAPSDQHDAVRGTNQIVALSLVEMRIAPHKNIVEPTIRINIYSAKDMGVEQQQFVHVSVFGCKSNNADVNYTFVARVMLDYKLLNNTCTLDTGETTIIKEKLDVAQFRVKVAKIATNKIPPITNLVVSMDARDMEQIKNSIDIAKYVLDKLQNKFVNTKAVWNFSKALKICTKSIQIDANCINSGIEGGIILFNTQIDVISHETKFACNNNNNENHDTQGSITNDVKKSYMKKIWKLSFNKRPALELGKWFATTYISSNENIVYNERPKTFMLTGVPGSGKRELIEYLSSEHNIYIFRISMIEIANKSHEGDTENAIKDIFTKAVKKVSDKYSRKTTNGCLIVFDDLDLILPKMRDNDFDFDTSSNNPSGEDRMLAKIEILSIIDEIGQTHHNTNTLPLRLGCTVSSVKHLDVKLQETFDVVIDMGTPTPVDYYNIISYCFKSVDNATPSFDFSHTDTKDERKWIDKMVKQCNGLTRSDIQMLCGQMQLLSYERKISLDLASFATYSIWNEVLSSGCTPLQSNRKVGVASNYSNVAIDSIDNLPSWQSVGGLEHAKRVLEEQVIWPYLYPEEFARLNISSSNGILLYGPPGTGKTLLAKAVADYSDVAFISASITDLMRGDVGESEAKVAELFRVAREKSPCVVFLDEIQAIFGHRDSSGRLGTSMIAQLMMEMDTLEKHTVGKHENGSRDTSSNGKYKKIVVLAATNRIDLMDPSLLRPGRFETIVYVGSPSQSDREDILKLYLANMNMEEGVNISLTAKKLAKVTLDFTGADLYNLCQCAVVNSMKRSGALSYVHSNSNATAISTVLMVDFQEALESEEFV